MDTTIGKKIVQFRKVKGLTQEMLSELTGLNVRTIQRIESGEVDPRLHTLKTIAEALGVNLEELLPEPTQHELNQLAVLHVTPVAFFFLPVVGNILLPFIFWMMKREDVNGINKHGKEILNAQLTYSIIAALGFLVFIITMFLPLIAPANSWTGVIWSNILWIWLVGVGLSFAVFGVFPAVNAFRVYRGHQPWAYPLKIHFFK
jgi:uncharacterized Tic20 family protein